MRVVFDIPMVYRQVQSPSQLPLITRPCFSPAVHTGPRPPAPNSVLSHSQYDLRENSKHSEVLIDLTEYCGQLVEAKCLTVNPQDNNCLAVGASGPFVRLYDIRMIHNHRYERSASWRQVPGSLLPLSLIAELFLFPRWVF